jgi:hypothetical protein
MFIPNLNAVVFIAASSVAPFLGFKQIVFPLTVKTGYTHSGSWFAVKFERGTAAIELSAKS